VRLVGFIIRIRTLNFVSNHMHSGPQNSNISKITMLFMFVSISLPFCTKPGMRDVAFEEKYEGRDL